MAFGMKSQTYAAWLTDRQARKAKRQYERECDQADRAVRRRKPAKLSAARLRYLAQARATSDELEAADAVSFGRYGIPA